MKKYQEGWKDEKGKREEEKVFIGGLDEEEDDWLEVAAILDTGCNATLCGDL